MTRKDYVKLADMLYMLRKDSPDFRTDYFTAQGYERALQCVEDNLVRILGKDNARFEESKFRTASNPGR